MSWAEITCCNECVINLCTRRHQLISELVYTHAELVQVQAHGGDSSADEDPALFFLPHRPFGQDGKPAQPLFPPLFLLMKGSDWRGSGAGDAAMPALNLLVSGLSFSILDTPSPVVCYVCKCLHSPEGGLCMIADHYEPLLASKRVPEQGAEAYITLDDD